MVSWQRLFFYSAIIIVLQVWVFNPVSLFSLATPYIYPVLLLFFLSETSESHLLFFFTGLTACIDILSMTPGLHTASMLPFVLMRKSIIKPYIDRHLIKQQLPIYQDISTRSLLLLLELLFLHHLLLFMLDAFSFANFIFLLKRFISSLIASYLFAIIFMFIFSTGIKEKGMYAK